MTRCTAGLPGRGEDPQLLRTPTALIAPREPFDKENRGSSGVFVEIGLTAAAIDRIVQRSVILEFDLPSYRTNVAQNRRADEESDLSKCLTWNSWVILGASQMTVRAPSEHVAV